MQRYFSAWLAVCIFVLSVPVTLAQPPASGPHMMELANYIPPKDVKVMPVFFVPMGERAPTQKELDQLLQKLANTQQFYGEQLKGRDNFTLVPGPPEVYFANETREYYMAHDGADLEELFHYFQCNRYNCPYIFFTIFMNPPNVTKWADSYPKTIHGCPLNGGVNTGGGIVRAPVHDLMNWIGFQPTTHHELGHAFGLSHPSAYGYDNKTNPSIMSPDGGHWTGFIPEDLRTLALNKRVFHRFWFDPTIDAPPGYSIKEVKALPRVGGLPEIKVTTGSGETHDSKARNIINNVILPSKVNGKFHSDQMWHSAETNNGWVSLNLTFPMRVELSGIYIHSQCCGVYHEAKAVRISTLVNGKMQPVILTRLNSIDQMVTFPSASAQVWKIDFQAGPGKMVIIRGLQFYIGREEVFLPRFVYPK